MRARAKMTAMVFMVGLSPAIEAKSARHFGKKRKLADGTPGCETRRTPGFIYLPRLRFNGACPPSPGAEIPTSEKSSPKNNHSPGSTPKSISQNTRRTDFRPRSKAGESFSPGISMKRLREPLNSEDSRDPSRAK